MIAAVIGGTGLVGNLLIDFLCADSAFTEIRLLTRRPVEKAHPKLAVKLMDFKDEEWLRLALENIDVLFSCMGTTQSRVKGDKDLYRKIDRDIPVKAARYARMNDCKKLVYVSSIGADEKSKNFYLQLKGEIEKEMIALHFDEIHIFQPSTLLGHRIEKRRMEGILQCVSKIISSLLFGSLVKYKAINTSVLAKAMMEVSKQNGQKVNRYTYAEIVKKSSWII